MDVPTITLWDKNLRQIGYVGDPTSLAGTLCHNAVGTMTLTLPTRHRHAADIAQAGNRMTVDYRGEQIFSGPMRSFQIDSGPLDSTTQATFEDDFRLFTRTLALASPSASISSSTPTASQTAAADVVSGPAETVLKNIVSRNIARKAQKVPVTVAPDLGRGSRISVSSRNQLMSDVLIPAVDGAGIGVEVRQGSSGLAVDVYETSAYPDTLTDGPGGVIESWSATGAGSPATYWLAGWTGTGASQLFLERTNPDRESWWGDHIEAYIDVSSESTAADVQKALAQADSDAHEQTGISIVLRADKNYSYGGVSGLKKGQTVTLSTGGVTRTDVLRQVAVSWDVQNGFTINPTIGDITGNTTWALFKSVAIIAKKLRNLGR